tara:strand:+ start:3245 stop:5512 length:2268 start_codon:yes stop_codon:yes gene_type:complete
MRILPEKFRNKEKFQNKSAVTPSAPVTEIEYKEGASTTKEIQRQNNRNIKTYNDLTNILNYEFALDERARQFETDYQVTAIQRQQLRDNYIAMMKNRDIRMNAQLEAYGASADQTAQQLKFNTRAADQAYDNSELRLVDRLKGIDFNVRGARLESQSQLLDTASQFASSQDTLNAAELAFLNSQGEIADQFTEAERVALAANALRIRDSQADYDETILAAANQRAEAITGITNQQSEATRAVKATNLNALNSLEATTGEAYRAALVQADELTRATKAQTTEATRAVAAQVKEINRAADAQADELRVSTANQRQNAITSAQNARSEIIRSAAEQRRISNQASSLQFDSQIQEINDAIANNEAQAIFNIQQQQIQQLVQSGSAAATGRRGTTTQRALRTIGVLSSSNNAKILSDITRFKTQQERAKGFAVRRREIAEQGAAESELSAVNQADEQLRRVTADADESVRATDARISELLTSTANETEERTTAAANQTQEALTAAANRSAELKLATSNQNANRIDSLKSENKERLTGITNDYNERFRSIKAQSIEAERSAGQRALNRLNQEQDSANETLLASTNAATLNRTSATNRALEQINFARDRAATTQTALTERANIMAMRTELTLEELGESMVSAMNAFQQDKQQIFMDKFQSDAQTIANMMAKPQFADAPPTPFVIPDPEFIIPPMPIESPKATVPPLPPQPSGLSKALMIGGAVLAAAGTAGMSIGLLGLGTIGNAGVAAIGSGISGIAGATN